jgi:hypothetical protein
MRGQLLKRSRERFIGVSQMASRNGGMEDMQESVDGRHWSSWKA